MNINQKACLLSCLLLAFCCLLLHINIGVLIFVAASFIIASNSKVQ